MSKEAPLINLQLDVPIQSMQSASPIKFEKSCISSLCWYEINKSANDNDLPSVLMSVAGGQLRFDSVTNITSVMDQRFGNDVQDLSLTLRGLPDNSSHVENMKFIYGLIAQVIADGWADYYFPFDPRVPGSEADKIHSVDSVLGVHVLSHPWFKSSVKMTLEQWSSNHDPYYWYFYKGGVYLKLEVDRADSDSHPELDGNYLVSMEFQNETDFWKSSIESEQMTNWVALLPAQLAKDNQQRQELEAKAKASGIKIDETYQDPPIKALGQ